MRSKADIRQANGLELHAPSAVELSADRLQQHRVPVEIQELLLATGEHAHVYDLISVDTHSLKRGTMRDWRND